MAAALRQLGYTVYDYMEQYEEIGDELMKISKYGGTVEDFRRIFEGVDAVTDIPAYHYWEQILEAFPDAKIIHCERDSEDKWYVSWERQLRSGDIFIGKLVGRCSPSWWKFFNYNEVVVTPILGTMIDDSLFRTKRLNELLFRMAYRRHNACIASRAPKHKLLMWNLGDSWQKLCEFIGEPVPEGPFPHQNKKASLYEDLAKTNTTFKRIIIEGLTGLALISVATAYGAFKISKGPGWCWLLTEAPLEVYNRICDSF